MRIRPTARVMVIDPEGRVLLLRFEFKQGPMAGTVFWATPGGEVYDGESYEHAARRELYEEVGIEVGEEPLGEPATEREFPLVLPDGEKVHAVEKIFVIRVKDIANISADNQTEEEKTFLVAHKWWHADEIDLATEKIYPEDLSTIVRRLKLT